jgi:hypothetical protein
VIPSIRTERICFVVDDWVLATSTIRHAPCSAHTVVTLFKALAACASVAAGTAALGFVVYLQSDPLAFTNHRPKNLLKVDWPNALLATVASPSVHYSRMQLDELVIEGRLKPPPPARHLVVSIEPPCIPGWRELLTGPEGRKVRDLCPGALAPAGQPAAGAVQN